MKTRDIVILIFLQIQLVTCLFDPVTIGLTAGVGYALHTFWGYDRCGTQECCNEKWIRDRRDVITRLEGALRRKLHGQQVAASTVLHALKGHLDALEPPKALTMSFHGLPGSGKNFVVNMITEAMFEKKSSSLYYHFFNGRSFAPKQSRLEYYKDVMRDQIVQSLMLCERSMFVFDEVDMMPVGLLDVVVPFIDYTMNTGVHFEGKHHYVKTNKAIFIFLSNTGSTEIVQQMLKFWEAGKDRDKMKLSDFENLITIGAFNEKGGFQKSEAIRTNLIDHYVPFMPLEDRHVRLCMKDSFRGRTEPTESMEEEVLASVSWGPEPHNIYARSGCKKIEQKVISVSYQRYQDEL